MFETSSDGCLNNVKKHDTELAKDLDIMALEPQCALSSQAQGISQVHKVELLNQELMEKVELLTKSLTYTRDLEQRFEDQQRQNHKLLENYRKEYSRSLELSQQLSKKIEDAWFLHEQIDGAGHIETTLVQELADIKAAEVLEEEETPVEATMSDFVSWLHAAGHKVLCRALDKITEHIPSDLPNHAGEVDNNDEELPVSSLRKDSIPQGSAVADNYEKLTDSYDDSESCSSKESTFTTLRKWIFARFAGGQTSKVHFSAEQCFNGPSNPEFRSRVRSHQAHESKAIAKHQLVRIRMPEVVVKHGEFPRGRFKALKKKHENDERRMFAQGGHDCPRELDVDEQGEITADEVTESRFERRIRLMREARLAQAE
ncbi:hypothetical protein E4T39_07877 [Aureobasidium subglaciale]|nr:hypothetical protein E4T39_07877 [Aureobasidium subglaciale]